MAQEGEVCTCAALRQAARHLTRLYDEALAPARLSLNQFSILSRLSRLGPQTLAALAGSLVMERSTLGHLLRPLQQRGLVSIGVAEADRRRRQIALTAAGHALVVAARPLWAEAEARFGRAFGTEGAHALRGVLRKVAQTSLAPA